MKAKEGKREAEDEKLDIRRKKEKRGKKRKGRERRFKRPWLLAEENGMKEPKKRSFGKATERKREK